MVSFLKYYLVEEVGKRRLRKLKWLNEVCAVLSLSKGAVLSLSKGGVLSLPGGCSFSIHPLFRSLVPCRLNCERGGDPVFLKRGGKPGCRAQ